LVEAARDFAPTPTVEIALRDAATLEVRAPFSPDVRPQREYGTRIDLTLQRIDANGTTSGAGYARIRSTCVDPLPVARFDGLLPGKYVVEFKGSGLAPGRSSEVELVAGQVARSSFELRDARRVLLRVVDPDGAPLDAALSVKNTTCYCDESGRRTIDDLPWDEATVEVSRRGFVTQVVYIPPSVTSIPDVVLLRSPDVPDDEASRK
jgi:hypothetical protein